MHDRNGKSERIVTKLGADIPEYICEKKRQISLENIIWAELFAFEYRRQNTA